MCKKVMEYSTLNYGHPFIRLENGDRSKTCLCVQLPSLFPGKRVNTLISMKTFSLALYMSEEVIGYLVLSHLFVIKMVICWGGWWKSGDCTVLGGRCGWSMKGRARPQARPV